MRNYPDQYTAIKNSLYNCPIYLYTMHDINVTLDGVEYPDFHVTSYDKEVVFDEKTFIPWPVSHDVITESTQGNTTGLRLKLSNVSRHMMYYLLNYDGLRGKKVTIRKVFADLLDDPAACREDIFYVDSPKADKSNVELFLRSKLDVLSKQIPGQMYLRDQCRLNDVDGSYYGFKGALCGYVGAVETCDRSKLACKNLNNYKRFGGFPSIPYGENG